MKKYFFHLYILFIFSLLLVINSCKKKVADPVPFQYDYFPVNIGHYVIYQVDSTILDDFTGTTTTYSYQIKEQITSEYKDNESRPTARIERSWRKDVSSNWQIIDIWSANRTTTYAERSEENVRYMRLKFPPKKGLKWDGNIFNTSEEMEYTMDNVDVSMTINGNSFDKTISITQLADTSGLLSYRLYKEIYVYGVGMGEKEVIDVADNNIQAGVPVLNRAKKGYKLTYKLIEYGN